MIKILVLLALFIANPLIAEDPTPEIPVVEVTEEPTEEPVVEPPVDPIIEVTPEPTDIPIEEPTPEPIIEPEIIEETYEKPTIGGCTDKRAVNYITSDENWNVVEDGSCYFLEGCTDPDAANYVNFGMYTKDDGSCYYLICNDETGCDASYTNPNKKSVRPDDKHGDVQPVLISDKPEESELVYIFSLDSAPFEEAIIQEVCQE